MNRQYTCYRKSLDTRGLIQHSIFYSRIPSKFTRRTIYLQPYALRALQITLHNSTININNVYLQLIKSAIRLQLRVPPWFTKNLLRLSIWEINYFLGRSHHCCIMRRQINDAIRRQRQLVQTLLVKQRVTGSNKSKSNLCATYQLVTNAPLHIFRRPENLQQLT